MVVWAIADRFLDMVGLFSLLYWTIKGCKWWWGPKAKKQASSDKSVWGDGL